MGFFQETAVASKEAVVKQFRSAGALSRETAKSLSDIGLDVAYNVNHAIGLHLLLDAWQVRRRRSLYYLDEDAIDNPHKTRLAKFYRLLIACFLTAIALTALIAALGMMGLLN